MTFPAGGRPAADILAELEDLSAHDVDWEHGRAFTLAYTAGPEVAALAKEANARFLSTNALNVDAFPSLRRMQSDVVGWMAELLNGGDEAAGFMTTGGTESILLAVKAARERGRAERGISVPEVILPTTAHAAFEKAAYYFGLTNHRVAVLDDYRADVDAMAGLVNENTVLLVASAPQYPQGVIDDVAGVAAVAEAAGVNCHVDACMGGITLPYLERLGYPVPPFDFRVPGVTSMSADLHKYGYTAKGASVILHRTKALRRYQTFVTDNWLGGVYGSSGVLGTKSGGSIAAAWAVMQYLGDSGYRRVTGQAKDAHAALLAGLRDLPEVQIRAEPEATLVAFGLDGVDTFAVGDALWRQGWYVDKQGPPDSLHLTVNAVHGPHIEPFLAALAAAIDEVRSAQVTGDIGAYGTVE